MKRIVTITMSPTVDLNTSTDTVTAEDKLRCKNTMYSPGGGGINVSRAIKILDGESIAFYPYGGYIGNLLKELLKEEKIDQSPIKTSGSTRLNFSVIENSTNKQYRFNTIGSNLKKEEQEKCLEKIKNLVSSTDYIVLSGSMPPGITNDFTKKLAEIVNKSKGRLIVDTSAEALKYALEEGVFLIKPNLKEFTSLIGEKLRDEKQLFEKAKNIIDSAGSKVVTISLGAAGCLLITKNEARHLCSPITPIQSRVGSGDSMVGAIALSLSKGKKISDSVKYGVAAGAAAVMTPGTKLCRKEDTERLYNSMKD
ncbi:MAG: 1-phosphofructokinase family hexose kinase [Candidatus Thermoplasmatota archaeon]